MIQTWSTKFKRLKDRKAFVVWKDKTRPRSPITGKQRGWNESPGTLEDCERFIAEHDGYKPGLLFQKGDGLYGIDLDDCRNPDTGEIDSWALRIVEEVASYAEVSQSGTGLKILAESESDRIGPRVYLVDVPRDRYGDHKPQLEIFKGSKYFALTGKTYEDFDDISRHELAELSLDLESRALVGDVFYHKPDVADIVIPISTPGPTISSDSPEYVAKFNRENSIASILVANGWTDCGRGQFKRPGKETDGISASIKNGRLTMFSSSVPELPSTDRSGRQSTYDAWSLFVRLEKGGDFERAAREYTRPNERRTSPEEDFAGLVTADPKVDFISQLNIEATEKLAESANYAIEIVRKYYLHSDGFATLRRIDETWYLWNGARFIETSDESVEGNISRWLGNKFARCQSAQVAEVKRDLKWILSISEGWIGDDGPKEPLATRAGIIDLATNELWSATPRLVVFSAAEIDGVSDEPPSRWLKFLDEIFEGDEESIKVLQRWFGYCLTEDTSQQKIMAVIGPPRSGKGTIGRILTEILGRSVASPTIEDFSTQFGLSPLVRKGLAIIGDARISRRADHAAIARRLLGIAGEDEITIDIKYKEPFVGRLRTKIMILSNELPAIVDNSGALASRLILLKTPTSFFGREDYELERKLKAELPSILKWAIDGRDGQKLNQPESSRHLIKELRTQVSPVREFVQEQCELGPDLEVEKGELYKAYESWMEERDQHALRMNHFSRELYTATGHKVEAAKSSRVTGRRPIFRGISIAGNWPEFV